MGNNNITNWDFLSYLTNLQALNLDSNKLPDIPADIFDRLPYLLQLDLKANEVSSLPAALKNICLPIRWDWLKNGICLKDNPLTNLPVSVVEEGTAAVWKYLD